MQPSGEVRTLLIGRDGQVGHELTRALRPLGALRAIGREAIDLRDTASIRRAIRESVPSLIVNAAAYTAVDAAEDDEAVAMAINATAPGVMAEESARIGAVLIHFSTDYVFDGSARTPYVESDPTNPLNAYGRSKLAGERAVLATDARALVFRLSWVYGGERRNFLTTVRRLAAERDVLRIVDDQIGLPTWSGAVADAVARIAWELRGHAADERWLQQRTGIYHLAGAGDGVSWADFAEAILREAPGESGDGVTVARIPSSEYPTPARRPAYSVLSAAKADATFGVRMPPWRQQLQACLRSASWTAAWQ